MRAEHQGPLCHMLEKQLSLMRNFVANSATTRVSHNNRVRGPDSGPEFTGRHNNINELLFTSKKKRKGTPSWAMPSYLFSSWDSCFVNDLFWTYSLITSTFAGAVGVGCGYTHHS